MTARAISESAFESWGQRIPEILSVDWFSVLK